MAYRDPERKREANRRFYERTRERQLALSKARYQLNRAKRIEQTSEARRSLPTETRAERYRRGDLKRHFGITVEQYDALSVKQGGLCAICRGPPGRRRLAVDHHHGSKAVRALLCMKCNPLLGYAQESPSILLAAVDYLIEHGSPGILQSKEQP